MPLRHVPPIMLVLALAVLCGGCGSDDRASATTDRHPDTVQLGLDFTPNAVHAPLYTAIRTQSDEAHGIHLVIRQPGSGPDALKQVAAGRLDLGVLDIHDLAIARERGIDVVGVAALVRKPLAALVTKASIKRPRDLEGHDVGVSGLPSDPAFLDAIIAHDGGKLSRVHQITIGFNAVSGILAGKVDGAPVFWNAEGVALKQRGVKVNEFRVEDYGAPAYPEVVLVTARRTLERERDRVRRALLAIRAGAVAVARDPDAAVRQIAHEAQTDDMDLIGAQLAAVAPIFARDLRLDRRVLEEWADFDVRLGIVEERPDVGKAFDFSLLGQS
jgi:NitT/TauT family transport system substrate-binding protein/putative hydroxymethylpyrimidine transport system substrate-binding protein